VSANDLLERYAFHRFEALRNIHAITIATTVFRGCGEELKTRYFITGMDRTRVSEGALGPPIACN
jgi:hypothetical protein